MDSLTVLDRSNYLKGLLILARQDKRLVTPEKDYIRGVAQRFGFSRDFYEDTLKSLMTNKYIKEEPIRFSSATVAELFLRDGISMAYSDNSLDVKELSWLQTVADANAITPETFHSIVDNYREPSSGTKEADA